MTPDTVSPWLRLSTFLAKGPRYLATYGAWRARRLVRGVLDGAAGWPAAAEVAAAGTSPVALVDPSRLAAIAGLVPEEARAATIARAGDVLERRFRHRGHEVRFDGPVDWTACPGGNRDWTWELNRHHFFVTLGRAYAYTGDERFARGYVDLLQDWMRANPPAMEGAAWRSVFEAGVRVANWCWGEAHFRRSTAITGEVRTEIHRGLLGIARFLEAHLERHAWNNHLLLEARALAMAGLVQPQLPGAERWSRVGGGHLEAELDRQVLVDGVHAERSSLYHAIIASELLEHLVVLRLAGRGESDRSYCKCLVKLVGMAMFLGSITRVDRSWPLLGDASRGDEHVRFDAALGARALLDAPGIPAPPRADESLVWLLASLGKEELVAQPQRRTAPRVRASREFRDGGYFVLEAERPGAPLHMVFDCGPFGDPIVPGHGHADALSVDVAVGSCHAIVDPGMYSAHLGDRWRNHFRGTAAHNTVQVDGRDQSILHGLRRVFRPARSRLIDWAACDAFDVAAGAHLGYARLEGRVLHQREILFLKPRWWLVIDRLEGRGGHRHEQLWHLHPQAASRLDPATRAAETRGAGGQGLCIVPVGAEDLEADLVSGLGEREGEPVQGWVAFASGVKEAAPVLRYGRAAVGSAVLATFLVPLDAAAAKPPRAARLEALSAAGLPVPGAIAARLETAGGGSETVFALPIKVGRPAGDRSLLGAGGLSTDALLACLVQGPGGEIEAGLVYRGWELRHGGEPVARFEVGELPGHFAFRRRGSILTIDSTGAMAQGLPLRFFGAPAQARQVTWNGCEPDVRREGSSLLVTWRENVRGEVRR